MPKCDKLSCQRDATSRVMGLTKSLYTCDTDYEECRDELARLGNGSHLVIRVGDSHFLDDLSVRYA